ncbi:MAG: hypothetical protein LBV77_02445 [Candidatus Adiutrix intracellularis]|jgi:hypothetical protein|nr:hypothetical protein [Candidatus Adiutrix intracellularis]
MPDFVFRAWLKRKNSVPEMKTSILEIRNLSKNFGGELILNSVFLPLS